jgi:hypothetical protein
VHLHAANCPWNGNSLKPVQASKRSACPRPAGLPAGRGVRGEARSGAATPRGSGRRTVRQGDQAGRVAADDHHACLSGEGQPVPAAPAQRAGDLPVGHGPERSTWAKPVHHAPREAPRRAAQCGRGPRAAGSRAGRPAGGEGMTGAIRVPVTAASRGGGGTGQRRGEAAGISRAVRVFKRCSKRVMYHHSGCPRTDTTHCPI